MKKYKEIDGDLIVFAKEGKFDVITHGCNCFNTMGAGIAPQMAKAFGCDTFSLEKGSKGDLDKLGRIDFQALRLYDLTLPPFIKNAVTYPEFEKSEELLYVVNSYTQYHYGKNHSDGIQTPINYTALAMCMNKINSKFKGKHIGLPRIGAGLAGGDWDRIKNIIQSELKDCDITIVNYKK